MQSYDEIPYLDVFSEISINLYRLCLIIEKTQYNTKGNKVLTLDKLSFLDAVVVDARLVNSVMSFFKKNHEMKSTELTTYISYTSQTLGYVLRDDDVRKRVVELHSLGLIDVAVDGGEMYITYKGNIDLDISNELVDVWVENISLLKFCVAKSFNQLMNSLMDKLYE